MQQFCASRPTLSFPCSPTKTRVNAKWEWRWSANRQTCDRYCNIGKNAPYIHHSMTDKLYRLWASEWKLPCDLVGLAEHIKQPDLIELMRHFLHDQLHSDGPSANEITLEECPEIDTKMSVFGSAIATFYAPSDECELRGMRRKCIWSTHLWRNQGPHCDCALVVKDETKLGIKGLMPVRVMLFFSFIHQGKPYPCALVEWFKKYGSRPDKETGMWKVRPHMVGRHHLRTVIHLDSFL